MYHHWDGYPSGLGQTLFNIRKDIFAGDTARMLSFLIDSHPGGWSTINADWTKPIGTRPDDNYRICKQCDKPSWRHYRQYYAKSRSDFPSAWECTGRPYPPVTVPADAILVLGHLPLLDDETTGPEPYPKGDLLSFPTTEENASGCGCEYAYVFEDDGKRMLIQSSYYDPEGKNSGSKMIGGFGCGDEKAIWKTIAIIELDGPEPEWDKIEV